MDSNIIIDLLTHFTTSHNAVVDPTLKSVVEALLTSLHTHPADHSISSSTTSSPALIDLFIQLQSILPQSDALESALASAITRSFPPLYDGTLPPLHSSQSTVQELLAYTEPLWTNRLNHLRHINVESFLQKDKWTQSTVQIVSSLIYVQSATRKAVFEQLGGLAGKCGVEGLGRVVLALVDSFENSDDAIAGLLENLVIPFQVFTQALTQPKEQHQPQTLALCAWCTATIIIRAPSLQSRLLRYLTDAVSGIPKTTAPNSHFISVVRRLQKSASQGKELDELVEALVSRGLVCAVVRLTSSTDTGAAVESTGKLDEASYAMFSELGKTSLSHHSATFQLIFPYSSRCCRGKKCTKIVIPG